MDWMEGVEVGLERRERKKRKREWLVIALLLVLFTVLTVIEFRVMKVSNVLPFIHSLFFFALLNINLVILIALVWLVFRNIGKLFLERRRKILGSQLKTKLVLAFLGFSIIPTLVLFVISAMYINSSFEKWFSQKIQNTLQASLEITHTYYRSMDQTAMHFAEHLSSGVAKRFTFQEEFPKESVTRFLEEQRSLLALDAVEFYPEALAERVIVSRKRNTGPYPVYPRLSLDLLDRAFSGENVPVMQHVGTGDLIRSVVPVWGPATVEGAEKRISGVIVVSTYVPVSLVNRVDEIASVFDDYKDVNPLKYPMKTTYFVILIMITLVILFVAIWIGLYLAKELTVPVARLVRGAQAVGAGNLDVQIKSTGHDEISVLVDSFNRMITDLRENRKQLTKASADLEKRRMQLEAVLANVGTGVLVVDRSGVITTFNRAVSQLLGISPAEAEGRNFHEILSDDAAPLVSMMDQALSSKIEESPWETQWSLRRGDKTRVLTALATFLVDGSAGRHWGIVVVIDDMTHLVKGQREMAWREVARRIAHEIKNPLTPIKLSAQRMQRRLGGFQEKEVTLFKECTETIIKHTDELKEMVNEFSNFARFPEVSPAPHEINAAVKEVVSLYEQAHPRIHFDFQSDPKVPVFEFDRDQVKRVLINLLDNAVAALGESDSEERGKIEVDIRFHDELQLTVIIVRDNGPGMTDEVRGRIFEPYFSTKAEGTGLGLAIAKRIINDHDGFIRVQSAPGEGTQFIVELPVAQRLSFRRRGDESET